MNKKLISKIVFYVVAAFMVFSIFFFFLDVFKWTYKPYIEGNIATPSFFDFIFGNKGSRALEATWAINTGMVALFVLQILLCVAAVVMVFLTFIKKEKVAYLAMVCFALLSATCGILTLCATKLSPAYILPIFGKVDITEIVALGAGAYVYGIIMIVTSVAAFVPYTIRYCLK